MSNSSCIKEQNGLSLLSLKGKISTQTKMDSDDQSNDQSVSQNEEKVHVTSPNEEEKVNDAQKEKNDDIDVNDVNSNKKNTLVIDTSKDKGKNLQDHEGYDHPQRLEVGHKCKKGWYELRPRGKLPEKRSYHSSVIHAGYLYVYGGEDSREGKFDNLWRLNLDEFIEIGEKLDESEENKDLGQDQTEEQKDDSRFKWELVETSGAQPGELSHHQSVLISSEMFIFGGMKPDGESNKNLYCLNLNFLEWKIIHPDEETAPQGRDDHSICHSDDCLFVFGGFVKGKRMNDLYQYSISTQSWELLSEHHELDEFSSEELKSNYPVPRCGQDMIFYNNKIYMFGGRNDFNDKLDDTWEFDISSRSWSKIE